MQCESVTKKGERCKNKAKSGTRCGTHAVKEECCVCFEEKRLQSTDVCTHHLCSTCLSRVDVCPVCRARMRHRNSAVEDTIDELARALNIPRESIYLMSEVFPIELAA